MRKVGYIFLAVLLLLVFTYLAMLYSGITFFLNFQEYAGSDYKLTENAKVRPLEKLDFDEGEWVVYVYIDPHDLKNLPPDMKRATCFKAKSRELLRKMRDDWEFVYTGGDMATVSSGIYFYRDGKLVFESGVEINGFGEGLQSGEYGWLEPVEKKIVSKYIKEFDRVYRPFVVVF